MIHELRAPSYYPNLGTFKKFFFADFFVLWILDLFAKYPASQFGKHFFCSSIYCGSYSWQLAITT